MVPGATALTMIPDSASSTAMTRVMASIPALVTDAGIAGPNPLIGRAAGGVRRFATPTQVNALGTVNITQQAAPAMAAYPDDEDEDRRLIVNTSSIAAFDGQRGETAYSASKGAVAAMTLPAAGGLVDVRIRVVAIVPGRFRTSPMEKVRVGHLDDAVADVQHPHRFAESAEFASLAMHIVNNPMINRAVIRIDAALRMAWCEKDRCRARRLTSPRPRWPGAGSHVEGGAY